VRCEECREAISARLDGEDEPAGRAGTDAHLAGCAECRGWRDEAIVVTRLARTGPVTAGRGVDDEVLTAAPGPGRGRLTLLLRGGLGALGAVQLVLGLVQVTGFTLGHTAGHAHPGVAPDHLWHESAAWNVAVGAGFIWVALARSRPGGLLPILTAFVAVLGPLSLNDVIAGRVDSIRLLGHGFLVAGYLIILALSYRNTDPGEPPAGRRTGLSRWRARFDDEPAPDAPRLRLLPGLPADGHASTRPAASRDRSHRAA
jgi:predicted anti-sigma-YlaC factor YlaD